MLSLLVAALLSAAGDNNVQWNGVSHIGPQDRLPLCPVDGEAFAVTIQTYRFDVDTVRVFVDAEAQSWVDAAWVADRDSYAIWEVQIPASSSGQVRYWFELTDGSDVDYYSVNGMSDAAPTDGGFLIDYLTLSHAPLGATPLSAGGVVFRVWAPTATQAYVRGSFNGWGLGNPMTASGGYHTARVSNASVNQDYKYFFNPGGLWKPDPRARSINGAATYNSIIRDPFSYQWQTQNFDVPSFEDMIVYELHVGTFAGRNDPQASGLFPATYLDVAAHVDHLVELGVNVVELMPVAEFPGDLSAGYNPITQFSPELKYGHPDALKQLVDTLNANGIAVIHDIVWNHFSGSDNFLWQYDGGQIYFRTPNVETPWGSQADFGRQEVREYFIDSMRVWLDEFRMSGFRMDATEFMNIFPQEAAGWSLMQWYNNSIDNRWIDSVSFAEQLPDDPWVTRPASLGGAGFDSQWFDAFTDRLREAILAAAFGDPCVGCVRDVINGFGVYLENQKVMNYLELHDEAWPSSGGQRLVKTIDTTFPHDDKWARGRTKLGHGVVMFSPGIPALLQGSEWLEDADFGTDPGNRIDWSKKQKYADVYQYHRDIIHTRKTNEALRASAPRNVFHVNEGSNVLAWHRWTDGGNNLVIIANFSNTNFPVYNLGLPQPGTWYELVNSQASEYGGNGVGNGGKVNAAGGAMHGFAQSASLVVPEMGLVVLRHEQPPCPDADSDWSVGQNDLNLMLASFGTCAGDAGYDFDADFDRSGCVNQDDLNLLLSVYGGPCPY